MSSLFDNLVEIEAARDAAVAVTHTLAETTHGGRTLDRIAGDLAVREGTLLLAHVNLGRPVLPPALAPTGR
jgi:hypothetical protein